MSSKSDTDDSNSSKGIFDGSNKTQEALDEKEAEKEEEKKKELNDAKKNSTALANRYGKADMMKMQARNIIMMAPFIAIAAVALIVILLKGGDWLSKGLNYFLFKSMTGSK